MQAVYALPSASSPQVEMCLLGVVDEVFFIWPNCGSPPPQNMREHTQACKANPLRVLGIFRCARGSQMGECDGGLRWLFCMTDGKNGCTVSLDMVYHIRNEAPCPRRPEHTLDPDR